MIKIAFAGGGTLGPVTPLIATARALKRLRPDAEFVWFGTPDGPERSLVEAEGIRFFSIPVAKLPRYPSLRWLTFLFDTYRASRIAHGLIAREKPDVIVSAGGFTAVPVIKGGRGLGIPCAIHQLDAVPGLSNKAVAKLCRSVTSSFEYESPPFGSGVKTQAIPTPVSFHPAELPTRIEALDSFGLRSDRPCVLVVGGGTGAQALNAAVGAELERLLGRTQLIHSTGAGKKGDLKNREGYFVVERFSLDEMRRAYAAADLVVTRAGMGALSELSALRKPCIIVPIPGNQQEQNAKRLKAGEGVMVMEQSKPGFPRRLREAIERSLDQKGRADGMHRALPTDDGSELARRVLSIMK